MFLRVSYRDFDMLMCVSVCITHSVCRPVTLLSVLVFQGEYCKRYYRGRYCRNSGKGGRTFELVVYDSPLEGLLFVDSHVVIMLFSNMDFDVASGSAG